MCSQGEASAETLKLTFAPVDGRSEGALQVVERPPFIVQCSKVVIAMCMPMPNKDAADAQII